jgi:hypothetical protein
MANGEQGFESSEYPVVQPLRYALPGPYQTQLGTLDEADFQQWVRDNRIPFDSSPSADYDMRGYWQGLVNGDPRATRDPETRHFPDTWKTPFHKSFSDESIYAGDQAPHWYGYQLIDHFGRVVADETPKNLR